MRDFCNSMSQSFKWIGHLAAVFDEVLIRLQLQVSFRINYFQSNEFYDEIAYDNFKK